MGYLIIEIKSKDKKIIYLIEFVENIRRKEDTLVEVARTEKILIYEDNRKAKTKATK